jgi:hypothetical protein
MGQRQSSGGSRLALYFFISSVLFFVILYLRDPFSLRAVAGLKYYVACLPLMFLIPYAIQDRSELQRLGTLMLAVAVPICIVGMVQYFAPPESAINKYAWGSADESAIATFAVEDPMSDAFGARPRITGTFSYISPMASFLQTMVLLTWVMLLGARTLRQSVQLGCVLALLLVAILMNGSRGLLLIATLTSVPFIIVGARRGVGTLVAAITMCGLVTIVAWDAVVSDAVEHFAFRATTSEDSEARLSGFFQAPIATIEDFGITGLGMGSTFAGGAEVPDMEIGQSAHDEVVHDKVGVELGALAYVMVVLFKLWLVIATLALLWRLWEHPADSLWALLALMIQVSAGFGIPFHNSVGAAAYFFAIGVVFLLQERWRRVAIYQARIQHERATVPLR